LTHDSPTRFVVGAISVRKGLAAKELANTLGPPTFNGVALRQKIGNGFVASDEDESLTDERCFENIAELGKASGREIRVPKKINGFNNAGNCSCAGQRTRHKPMAMG
jgi:hypothetical protein